MTKASVLAYCAGVIDSDGTIGIKKFSYSMRVVKDSSQAIYSARICVRQVTPEAVNLLSATFGGNVRPANTYAKRGRPMLTWEVRDKLAEAALRLLLPHLRIKKQQAENCLELRKLIARSKRVRMRAGRGHRGAGRRPAEIGIAMEQLKVRANQLNQVGLQ